MAYLLAVWCTGFAAVNGWDLLRDGAPGGEAFAEHESGLIVMSVLVLLLKLAGAAIAIAAVQPRRQRSWPLAAAVWAAASLLLLYSAGNLVITFGTVFGVMEPSEAWTSAGGVTALAVAYVLFFLGGAGLFTILAVSVHRRHRPGWTAPVAGAIGAPALLAGVLVVVPAVLTAGGLLPG